MLERRSPPVTRGFTLIELMVVIAIIVLAAGLMTPTITDFFKNRQLEGIRGNFGSAFNTARLYSVNQGRPVSVVFFREGVRVYDEKARTFYKDYFNPDTSALADEKSWYVLGFLSDKRPSTSLRRYRDWEKGQRDLAEPPAGSGAGGPSAKAPSYETYNVSGLPKITFQRDGSLVFATGDDVPSAQYKPDPPENADVSIYQDGNTTACFIDLKRTGQFKSKVVPLKESPLKPAAGSGDEDVAPSASVSEESPAETGKGE